MQSTLKTKIKRNLGANAYGQAITILIQLVSVPLFLHYWGVELYGEWLILSAIPAYLALSDIGFASVAANDMTMRVANNDRRGALQVYQSIWLFVTGVSLFVGCALAFLVYAIPVAAQLSIKHIAEVQTRQLLIVLVLYVLVGLQGGVFNAAFRAAGLYAYGTTLGNTIRLAEWALSMAALLAGGSVLAVASTTLATRLIGLLMMCLVVQRQIPWLTLGKQAASLHQVRALLKPAVAFMAFPLGLALSLQGMVLIIGITLGATAVVMFAAYRTLTRLLVQVITMINQAIWPEISAAYGAKQMELVRQLHRKGSNVTFWIALAAVTLLGAFGQWFVGLWTHHAFEGNQVLFTMLLLTTFFNVMWQTSWVVLMATNQHQKITVAFIASAGAGLLVAYFALPILGINGAGLVLAASELPMLYFAINSALHLLEDKLTAYFICVVSKPIITIRKIF